MRLQVAAGFFVAGVGVGAGGCYLYFKSQQPSALRQEATGRGSTALQRAGEKASVIRYHPALKFGVPITDSLRFYEGFVVDWDFRTRNPKWVLEHITKDSFEGSAERGDTGAWREDKGIDARMRSKLQDFKGSGYDRGHMAAAANHKRTQAEQDETFSLSNICPQVGQGFNRDYWARFERFCRNITKQAADVYVTTGPLWLPSSDDGAKWTMKYPLIGDVPCLISVPTHFYKVIMADNRQGRPDGPVGVAAFVMPNAPIEENKPLAAFVVPLTDLEAVAGTKFYPAYLTDERRKKLDEAAAAWRHKGLQQLAPFERVTMLQGNNVFGAAATPVLIPSSSGASSSYKADLKRSKSAPLPDLFPTEAGAHHLCEVAACTLPRADFFKAGKEAAAAAAEAGSVARR